MGDHDGDGGSGGDGTAENQYKDALIAAKPSAETQGGRIRDVLKPMERAFSAGAWQSTTATEFWHELTGRADTMRRAGDSVGADFNGQIHSEPDKVPENDLRADWYRFRRHIRGPGAY